MPKKQFITLLVFALTLGFYIYTLLPSLAWGDGVKLQSEAISGESFVLAEMPPSEFSPDPFIFSRVGVAAWDHPLYIVLGYSLVKAFPFVDSLWLVNLLSALFGAGSVALVFLLCLRYTENLFVSVFAALSLAVSHTFWWHSSTPEVYTLFVFLFLLSFYFFDLFEHAQRHIFLASSVFFLGLAASTHIMAFLAIPAFVLYSILSKKEGERGVLGTGIARPQHPTPQLVNKLVVLTLGFLIGFSLYLVQFIRMSIHFPVNEIMGPVLGSTFLSQLGTFSPLLLGESVLSYLFFLTIQFGPAGWILGGLGLRRIFAGQNVRLRKIVAFFIVFALFGIFYRVTDQFTFFIPSYLFWAMMMAIGTDYALKLLPGKGRVLLPVLLGLLLIATPFFYTILPALAERNGLNDASIGIPEIGTGVRNGLAYYINPNKRGDFDAYQFGYQTISNLAPGSVVIAEWYTDTDEYFILRYFSEIAKVRPDVRVVGWPTTDPFSFDSELALDVIEKSFPEQPVYLASSSKRFYAASKLTEMYCIHPENNLYRLYKKQNNPLLCLGDDALTE